ncbi:MAG: DUF1919 domain-containing protein [Lachnospiraceae bacterium]|nr:DUF1919 domain-containing protein [Lachnospiraceae bacterium]
MLKCILWGTGIQFEKTLIQIRYFEQRGRFEVIGITSGDSFYSKTGGYRFIKKEQLGDIQADFFIVFADGAVLLEIQNEICEMGYADHQVIPYSVIGLTGFEVDKYMSIKRDIPSIISLNCWGGITYHSLALPFASPFINMFLEPDDFLTLLRDLKTYLAMDIKESGFTEDPNSQKVYPVGDCGGVKLHFNHSNSFEEAKADWDKRRKRVNWDNLFIMAYTEDAEFAKCFSELPYEKKICFISMNIKGNGLEYVDIATDETDTKLWQHVNRIASRRYQYYDVFELLLSGEVVHIYE